MTRRALVAKALRLLNTMRRLVGEETHDELQRERTDLLEQSRTYEL